ncbi:MAG TPA: hypothetical protein VLK33_03245, partial [Terriglobales bacterium]|nr:hypothetical protein [Terriglobales bacterium]
MAWRKACISVLIFCTVLPSLGQSSGDGRLTVADYGAQLDKFIAYTAQPLTSKQTSDVLRELPPSWRVNINDSQFELSTQWLREDLLNYGEKEDAKLLQADHDKLMALRADLNAYVDTSPDNSAARIQLGKILSRREFESARGPGFIERLKQRLLLYVIRLLSKAFGSSAIPNISKYFIYGLVGLAVLALAYWIYRTLRNDARLEHIVPPTMA